MDVVLTISCLVNLEAPVIVVHSDASESDESDEYNPKPTPRVAKKKEKQEDSKSGETKQNNNNQASDTAVAQSEEVTDKGAANVQANVDAEAVADKGKDDDQAIPNTEAVAENGEADAQAKRDDVAPSNTNARSTKTASNEGNNTNKTSSAEEKSDGNAETRSTPASPTKSRSVSFAPTPEGTPTSKYSSNQFYVHFDLLFHLEDKKSKFFFRLSQRSLDVTRFNEYSKLLRNNDKASSLTIHFPTDPVEGIPAPFSQCWYDRHLVQVDGQQLLNDCGALASKLIVTNHHVMVSLL